MLTNLPLISVEDIPKTIRQNPAPKRAQNGPFFALAAEDLDFKGILFPITESPEERSESSSLALLLPDSERNLLCSEDKVV